MFILSSPSEVVGLQGAPEHLLPSSWCRRLRCHTDGWEALLPSFRPPPKSLWTRFWNYPSFFHFFWDSVSQLNPTFFLIFCETKVNVLIGYNISNTHLHIIWFVYVPFLCKTCKNKIKMQKQKRPWTITLVFPASFSNFPPVYLCLSFHFMAAFLVFSFIAHHFKKVNRCVQVV